MKLAPMPVEPIGSHRSPAFVHRTSGCRLEMVATNDYPPANVEQGEGFRRARQACDLSLREAAKVLGLSAVELSGLERGSLTLSSLEWVEALARLDRAKKGKGK